MCACAVLSAATFVGGGFIVGLTEAVYTPTMGLAWAVMPLTAALSFIVGKSFNNNTITCIISAFAHDFPFSEESGSRVCVWYYTTEFNHYDFPVTYLVTPTNIIFI